MTPQMILRELRKIQIGDILMSTSDGRQLALRRVARPGPDQARILEALKLEFARAACYPGSHFVVKTQPRLGHAPTEIPERFRSLHSSNCAT